MKKTMTAAGLILVLLLTSFCTTGTAAVIHDVTANLIDNTSVGVSWSPVEGEPLYTITCQAEGTDRVTERRTYHTYCKILYLSPETTYVITVSTKAGNTGSVSITLPKPGYYAGFNYQLLDSGVYKSTAYETDYTAVSVLNGAELETQLKTYDFSFLLKFSVASTRALKYLDFQLVLRVPNGDVYTLSPVLEYEYYRTTISEYLVFNRLLQRIVNDYGSFPIGEYTLTAYIENGIAGETSFTIE